MTRRLILQDWVVGAAAVASITVLGIPLRIFGNDPNAYVTKQASSTSSKKIATIANNTSIATDTPEATKGTVTPSTEITPNVTRETKNPNTLRKISTPSTAGASTTSITPIKLVKPIAVGETIVQASAVPRNSFVTFTLTSSQDPAVLIHLPNDKFVAYDATCTHLGCEVAYHPDIHILACPCHGSQFDPAQGAAVLHGPAAAPLSAVSFQIDSATGAIKLQS